MSSLTILFRLLTPCIPTKGLFKRAIFAGIFKLLTHAIKWIDLRIICAKLYCNNLTTRSQLL